MFILKGMILHFVLLSLLGQKSSILYYVRNYSKKNLNETFKNVNF